MNALANAFSRPTTRLTAKALGIGMSVHKTTGALTTAPTNALCGVFIGEPLTSIGGSATGFRKSSTGAISLMTGARARMTAALANGNGMSVAACTIALTASPTNAFS